MLEEVWEEPFLREEDVARQREQEAWVEWKARAACPQACAVRFTSAAGILTLKEGVGGPGARAVGVPAPLPLHPGLPVRRAGPASLSKKEEVENILVFPRDITILRYKSG